MRQSDCRIDTRLRGNDSFGYKSILVVEDFSVGVAVGESSFMEVVVLVVEFGGVELLGGGDFGFYFEAFLVKDLDEFLGGFFLVVVLAEDGGAVLGADVGALAVELGEIVGFEEEYGEFFVGGLVGIEGDQDGLGVSGGSGADLLIGGIGGASAGVADGGLDDAGGFLEVVFGAPEAAGGEDGGLGFGFGFHLIGGGEVHGDGVDAVAGVFGGVSFAGEDVAEVSVTVGA